MLGENKNVFTGILSHSQTAEVIKSLNLQKLKLTHKTSAPKVLLSSLLGSNASVGLLIGAPLVYRAGRYAGEHLQEQVLNSWNEVQAVFARFLPPFFALAALLMLAGWLFGVIYSAFRYAGAELLQNEEFIVARSGLWKRSVRIFSMRNVQGYLIRETPLMRAGRLCRLSIVAAASEETTGELPILLPLVKRGELSLPSENFNLLPRKEQYRVFLNIFYKYCAVTVIAAFMIRFFPAYKNEIFAVLVIFFIILIFLFAGKKIQLKTGGAGEKYVSAVRGVTRLTLFSRYDAHRETRRSQSYYQRRANVCKKGIYLTGGKRIKLNCIVQCETP